jgi:hypothetical protein
MLQVASAAARLKDPLPLPASVPRWKRAVFALLLSGLSICLPARGHTAGLDCPETGPGAVPDLLTGVQLKLVMSGNSVDLANEINDLINKLQIEKPNISYAELTNVIVAAYCPVVANLANLSASEKWRLMHQFDTFCSSGSPPTRWHRERSSSPTFHFPLRSTESFGVRPRRSIRLPHN